MKRTISMVQIIVLVTNDVKKAERLAPVCCAIPLLFPLLLEDIMPDLKTTSL